MDTDGDGVVSLEEFTRSAQALGMTAQDAREAFAAMDGDGEGQLTVEEWQQAVEDCYTSAESAGPGSLIMGTKG